MTPFETEISCDLLVVGAGFAGMVAAARASRLGLDVVRCGNPAQFYFASGAMDALGAYPLDQGFLNSPADGWDALVANEPHHPYAKSSWEKLARDFDFITEFLAGAGLDYTGNPASCHENILIPTALGTLKPAHRVPVTMAHGGKLMDEKSSGRLLLVDFTGLKGFSAAQMASGLCELVPNRFSLVCAGPHNNGWQIQTHRIALEGSAGGIDPLHLAARFETPDFVDGLVRELASLAKEVDLIGFPAVCGMDNCQAIMADLEKRLGTPLFEIPMMPPSIPGIRLKNAFERALHGVPFLGSARIRKPEDGKFSHAHGFSLEAHAPSLVTRINSRGLILATGSFPGGGLAGERTGIRETILDLPVFQPQSREEWHGARFFDPAGHGVSRSGIETDASFSPVDADGNRIHESLYAAGAILAHNDWTRIKSGSGVACLSAVTAVDDFHGRMGRP
ncbi:MAG: glycerol-3-phosphate dehydrogenase subunit GlpB [Desulfobacterales bacterium]|nr:glycerol-3-phosphate dehydrogenase subunit GlpB [Desulfobacterales bacterium]